MFLIDQVEELTKKYRMIGLSPLLVEDSDGLCRAYSADLFVLFFIGN